MSAESKDFDAYAIVLADLRAKREKIDQAIQAIEAMQGGGVSTTASSPNSALNVADNATGAYLGMSIAGATKKLLASKRKQMNNTEILAALQEGGFALKSADPLNTVGAVLTRRFRDTGDIVRVGRGTWGLKEWYPDRNFSKPAKQNGETEVKAVSSETAQPSKQEPDSPLDIEALLG